jgi:peptidoglycan/LPS O-acetylase OafA/YrhL
MKRLSGSSYSLIVVLVVTILFMVMSLELASFGSRFLPLVIGSIVLILAGVALAREIRTLPSQEANSDASCESGKGGNVKDEAKGYLRAGVWVVGLALAIYLIGFTIATFVVVGLYMKVRGSKWYLALITAVLYTGIIYAMFNIWLKADLYSGEVFKWLSN